MLRAYVATYERPAIHPDLPVITTRLWIRAEDHLQALRIADYVFESVYGAAPTKLGFTQMIVREGQYS